jgi:hypothetical protein
MRSHMCRMTLAINIEWNELAVPRALNLFTYSLTNSLVIFCLCTLISYSFKCVLHRFILACYFTCGHIIYSSFVVYCYWLSNIKCWVLYEIACPVDHDPYVSLVSFSKNHVFKLMMFCLFGKVF